jgi:hypothetical protein
VQTLPPPILTAEQHKLNEAAEFLKGFIIKWDVIKNKERKQNGTTTPRRASA